jgi:hypothetical protein
MKKAKEEKNAGIELKNSIRKSCLNLLERENERKMFSG